MAKKKVSKKSPARKVSAKRRVRVAVLKDVPAIGSYWKGQGGIHAGPAINDAGKQIGHIVVAALPANPTKLLELKGSYGSYGKTIGAASYRDSEGNTKKMLANDGSVAKQAAALNIEGHSDFSVAAQCVVNTIRANLPKLIAGIGWVVSSTESSANFAWCQDFSNGCQYTIHKVNDCSAFAVRVVPLSS